MNKSKNIKEITRFKTPEESPGYLLWHVSLAWRSTIENTLKNFSLTHPQFVVLTTTAWLTRKGTYISQVDISKTSGLDPNTTSQILRGLESKNFVQRTQSINEKSKNPSLTDAGFKVLQEALPAVEKADAHFFALLTVKEQESMIKLFQKLR